MNGPFNRNIEYAFLRCCKPVEVNHNNPIIKLFHPTSHTPQFTMIEVTSYKPLARGYLCKWNHQQYCNNMLCSGWKTSSRNPAKLGFEYRIMLWEVRILLMGLKYNKNKYIFLLFKYSVFQRWSNIFAIFSNFF